ncbi:MAG: tetratricopeptide repeat protein, partial [Myxococcota bacterium]|nr:tetratricopeptide repeat protein [Myxococcota bacterium]
MKKQQGCILSARAWIMTTVAVALLATPVTIQAQQPEAGGDKPAAGEDASQSDFDALVEIAAERYAEEDFEGAIAAFKKAHEAKPSESNILYNIGRLYEKTGNFESAIEYYEKFVNEPDIDIDARQDAVARIKTLREV